MRSNALSVDEFLQEYDEPLRSMLACIREILRSEVPDVIEGMQYGGPVYATADRVIVGGFMKQKHNLAVYVGLLPEELHGDLRAAGFNLGKTVVRFRRLDAAKEELLRRLLRAVIERGITCDCSLRS